MRPWLKLSSFGHLVVAMVNFFPGTFLGKAPKLTDAMDSVGSTVSTLR